MISIHLLNSLILVHLPRCNALFPFVSRAFTWAPFSINTRISSTFPRDAAQCNGVRPLLSRQVDPTPSFSKPIAIKQYNMYVYVISFIGLYSIVII
jgi:hypothetical protein